MKGRALFLTFVGIHPIFSKLFIKETILFPGLISVVCQKSVINMWVDFWDFYCVSLIFRSGFVPVPNVLIITAMQDVLKSGIMIFPFIFIIKDCFSYARSPVFPLQFYHHFF